VGAGAATLRAQERRVVPESLTRHQTACGFDTEDMLTAGGTTGKKLANIGKVPALMPAAL
jgi:hypothetical protein